MNLTPSVFSAWNPYHTTCRGSRKMFMWARCVSMHETEPGFNISHACVHTYVMTSSVTVWKCVWETCLSEDKPYFYHRKWSHPVGARADVSCLFQSSVCVCVCASVFVEEGEHRSVGASCLPSGSKVCVFPTNLQHAAKKTQRQHCLLACS